MSKKPFKIFSGRYSKYLTTEIAKKLGVEVGKLQVNEFADGEFQVSYEESVRGDEIYLVQSMFPPTDNLMELLLMIDAGVDSIITMDLHADQIQGFFNLPLNHLYASSVFVPYIDSLKLKDMVFASPDVGGAKRVLEYAKHYKVPMALCHKQRARANVVEKMTIIGDVKDKNVILVDDMIDTAGTICTAAEVMMKNGAKSVRAIASHGVMSDPATERINKSPLVEVVISDSINYDTSRSEKVKRVSVAGLIAETIQRINDHESISSQYLINH